VIGAVIRKGGANWMHVDALGVARSWPCRRRVYRHAGLRNGRTMTIFRS